MGDFIMEEKSNNVLLFLENRTEALDNRIALGMKSNLGWREITFGGLSILSRRLANFLINSGIEKGDKISILSESMPEWGAALFSAVLSGAIAIPLDIKLTTYELSSILTDCQPKILIVSTTFLETALKLKEQVPSIEQIIILNDSGIDTEYPCLYKMQDSTKVKWRHRGLNTTALIIYTSGTTGNPKGVEISFRNALSQVRAVGKCFDLGIQDQLLSILPMNHLFELTVGFLSFLNLGTSIYYSKSLKPKDIFAIMQEKQITFMVVVPAFLKLMKSGIESDISKMSPFAKTMFAFRYELAKFIPLHRIRKLLFSTIHKKFGGKFRGCISGGAPLDIHVGKFFENIGVWVFEGYGLSEASPVVSVNTKKDYRLGSVGKALDGVEAKIDKETGELMVHGANVMKGYYGKPELTAETVEADGWLHTGDIAEIRDGFIHITGRIKNMIVLSGGKKVFPEEVESVLNLSEKFQEVCVFGAKRAGGQKDGTEDIFAAIVPTEDTIKNSGSDENLDKIVRAEVKELSKRLSHYKRPNNIIVSKELFARTATKKIKRKEVKKLAEV